MIEDTKNQNSGGDNDIPESLENRLEEAKRYIASAYRDLEKIEKIVLKVEQDRRKEVYKSLPGEEGYFDGYFMVCDDGRKIQVPPNYSAKSKLVYGDKLKMITEGDKKLFKQIERADRETIEGVTSRKEGSWFVLTEKGSYRISNVAADYNKLDLNQKILVTVPLNDKKADFATFEEIVGAHKEVRDTKKDALKVGDSSKEKEEKKPEKKINKPETPKRAPKPVESKEKIVKEIPIKRDEKKETKKTEAGDDNKEFVANILGEDDLR